MSQGTGAADGKTTTVIDFNKVRDQKLDEKRRKTERIIFKSLLSVYCVSDDALGNKLKSIEPIDLSEDGFGFQVPFDSKNPWPSTDEFIPIRLYFSQDTYLPIAVKVVNSRPVIENGVKYVRYGCKVDATLSSYPAYREFVRFMTFYAEHARKDMGDVTLFYI